MSGRSLKTSWSSLSLLPDELEPVKGTVKEHTSGQLVKAPETDDDAGRASNELEDVAHAIKASLKGLEKAMQHDSRKANDMGKAIASLGP